MRLVIIAAIDHRRKRGDLLDHIAGKALPEGTGGQLYFMHGLPAVDHAGVFIGQINTRGAPKTEQSLIFTELGNAHSHTDLHQCIIAGIYNGILQCLISMSINIITINFSICNKLTAVTVKIITVRYSSDFQRRSNGNGFYRGTWFIAFRNAKIAPHGIQRFHIGILIHSLDLRTGIPIRQILRIIQVKAGISGHAQDLPVIGIHHHNTDILRTLIVIFIIPIGLIKLCDIFFNGLLDIHIQRSHQRFSVLRFNGGLLKLRIFIQIAEGPAVGTV